MVSKRKGHLPRCEHRSDFDFSVRRRRGSRSETYLKCNACGAVAKNPIKHSTASKFPQAPTGWSRGRNPTTPKEILDFLNVVAKLCD